MRTFVLVAVAAAFIGTSGAQEEASTPSPSPAPTPAAAESPMVKAAKSRAAAPKQKSRIRLTNEDVKKSTGKLTIVSSQPVPVAEPTPQADQAEASEKESRAAVQKRRDEAEKRIETLQKALDAAEEAYYNAEDPADRDVIERRFAQAKEDLEKARLEAQAAREELNRP